MKKNKVYIIALIGIIIDQFLKILVRHNMNVLQTIPLIPNFFSLTYVNNEGAAWGIFENSTIFLIFVSIIAILWLQKYIHQETSWNYIKILSFGFVLSGIVGNLIDRLLYMAVTDYLDFNIFGYNFPVFNFADIAIVVGISIMMIDEVRREVYEYRHKTK